MSGQTRIPRLIWHDRTLWIYTYSEGGFEGYRSLRGGRRLAPDLRFYARRAWLSDDTQSPKIAPVSHHASGGAA